MTWHAFYFDKIDRSEPAARTAIIQAETEEDAGRIAVAQMGRCMRVDVTRPVWGEPAAAVRGPGRAPAEAAGAA
ncbi:MAG: hypothetical protein ABR970_20325 [Roseiarcus sp.]